MTKLVNININYIKNVKSLININNQYYKIILLDTQIWKNEKKMKLFANNKRFFSQDIKGNCIKSPQNWQEIDWNEAGRKIKILQEKIVIAAQNKNYKEVYKWQWVILNSFSGRALAIRKVINNSGGKISGTDNVIWKNTNDYMNAVKELAVIVQNLKEYKAKPLKRVYIPKGYKGDLRPLGIPVLIDRALQALYYLGVDPVVEVNSDPHSYGFRKNRSTHDAIISIRSLMDKKVHSHWILEADISKCFDQISHDYLLKHTPICHKNVLEQWLKSGIMDEMNYLETEEGTLQGGIISPLLCNVALNGIEKAVMKTGIKIKGIGPGVHLIRYADDMIVIGKNKKILLKIKEVICQFLKERGLQLNENKTNIKKRIWFFRFQY